MNTIPASVAALLLVATVPSLVIVSKQGYLVNWDSPDLERFLLDQRLSGQFYSEGVRPYFVQRAIDDSKRSALFYDLNPRVTAASEIWRYELIRGCVNPDYWIIHRQGRDDGLMEMIRDAFADTLYDNGDIFIARELAGQPVEVPSDDCESLSMIP